MAAFRDATGVVFGVFWRVLRGNRRAFFVAVECGKPSIEIEEAAGLVNATWDVFSGACGSRGLCEDSLVVAWCGVDEVDGKLVSRYECCEDSDFVGVEPITEPVV
jgi:hypothetical protein